MICYIKSFKDFKTIAKYDAVNYSLADGEDGSVTIYEKNPVELTTKYVGCWLIIGDGKVLTTNLQYSYTTEVDSEGGLIVNISGSSLGTYENPLLTGGIEYKINAKDYQQRQYVYYISGVSPADDSLTLTIRHPIYAFDRPVKYDPDDVEYGPLIKKILDYEYGINCEDAVYAMTYMNVSNTDHTTCTIESDNYGYIVPSEIFEQARAEKVIIDFVLTPANTLDVNISTADYDYGVVVFGDGHSQLESESYDASFCSKITVLQELQEITGVLAKGDDKDIVADNLKAHIEIGQDIRSTWAQGKVQLMARFYVEWENMQDGDITFNENKLKVYQGNNSSGTVLLETAPEWRRSSEAGSMVTDWLNLEAINNCETFNIYVVFIVNGSSENQPGGRENYSPITVTGITPSTVINSGPVQGDGDDMPTLYRIHTYYLKTNGDIVTTQPLAEERMHGQWQICKCTSDDDPYTLARDIFASNSDNHKVEFYSDSYFNLFQPMKLRIRNEVLETIITSRVITRTDGRFYYKCGNLVVSLTDHMGKTEDSDKKKESELETVKSDIKKLQTQGQKTSQRFTKSVDDVQPRDIDFGDDGWVRIYPPSSFPAGAHIQNISLITWTNNDGAFDVKACGTNSDYAYVIGNKGEEVTGLKCRWWYA